MVPSRGFCVHVVPERVKLYPAPFWLLNFGAPTRTESPEVEIATLHPSCEFAAVSEAFRYACWLHVVPLRVNTNAAPASVTEVSAGLPPLMTVELLFSPYEPATSVLPSLESAMAQPRYS